MDTYEVKLDRVREKVRGENPYRLTFKVSKFLTSRELNELLNYSFSNLSNEKISNASDECKIKRVSDRGWDENIFHFSRIVYIGRYIFLCGYAELQLS